MKKAVMYGAGNIGRGFIGQLLFESGYHTTFIDINDELVNAINERKSYPLRILSDDICEDLVIGNVSAVNGRDFARVAQAVEEADLMATAVGANALPYIAKPVAAGLRQRNARPIDILLCENLKGVSKYFRALLQDEFEYVGLVETSIGRMAPLQTPELQAGDPMRVCVEAYATLLADKDAFRAGIPELKGLMPCSPFSFYVERKLYIHNMGHAITAYCGDNLGYTYIWQVIEDPGLRDTVKKAMISCADALVLCYQADKFELYAHVDDLLLRFANKKLGDTIYRVGRDLRRKLAAEDRMVGALRLCQKARTDTSGIVLGIARALSFSGECLDIPPERVLVEICGIGEHEPVYGEIIERYREKS